MALADPMKKPIEEVLDELIPDWRGQARGMSEDGATSAEIVAEFQRQMMGQIDELLDTYNSLGGNSGTHKED